MSNELAETALENTNKNPLYQTELCDLDDPETKAVFIDILKVCWKGMKFDEGLQKFVPE